MGSGMKDVKPGLSAFLGIDRNIESYGGQTFSRKDQIVNIAGTVGQEKKKIQDIM
jgi:hypothetical protein